MISWRSLPESEAVGSRGMVRRGLYAVEVFKALGFSPPASSRLPMAIKLLRALNDEKIDIRGDGVLERAANAQRTIWEFFVIAYAAELRRRRAPSIFPLASIELALSGAELETGDTNHLARNTQFELYTAALLCLGGADVVSGEPDLRLTVGSRVFGIAAKRLISLNEGKIKDRLIEGANQVLEHASEGYVAINVDAHFRGHDLPSIEEERRRLFSEKVALVSRSINAYFGPLAHMRGVIIYGHLSAWDTSYDPPRYSTTYPTSYQLIRDEEKPSNYEQERSFWTGYTSRVAKQADYLRSSGFQGP